MTTVYAFTAAGIEELATTLSQTLAVTLYEQSSPMIGTWYTDVNLQQAIRALKEGKTLDEPGQSSGRFQLVLNDPEPGYTSPEFPGEGDFLLRVDLAPGELADLELKLREAGLHFRRLGG